MGLIRRKNDRKDSTEEQDELVLRERALRLVDTRGVVVREAEAELHAAIAEVRSYATPERERRVAQATRALAEAKRALRDASAECHVAQASLHRPPPSASCAP